MTKKTTSDEEGQRNRELASLFNLSIDMLCVTDINGCFRSINNAWETILGYKKEELLSKPYLDFVHPDDIALTFAEGQKHLQGQRTIYFENRYRCKDGSYKWLAWTSSPRAEDGITFAVARDITDKKQLEEALRESEKRYRSIFENINDALWIHDFEGNIFDANRVACNMVGKEYEEVIGQNLDIFITKETVKQRKSRIGEIIRLGDFVFDDEILHDDGTSVPVEVSAKLVSKENGGVIQSFVRDITRRKQTEENMIKAQELFSKAFYSSPLPIAITSMKDGTIRKVNNAFTQLTGHKEDDLAYRSLTAFSIWNDPEDRKKMINSVIEKGFLQDMEAKIRTLSGNIRDCVFSAEKIIFDNEPHLISMAVDVTERNRAEKALRESEKKLRNFFNNCPMGIHSYKLDSDDRLIFQDANQAASDILGVDCQQFVDKSIEEAFPPLADTEVPTRYREAAAGKKWETEQIDYSHGEISGAFKVVAFQTSPNMMACLFEDIIERKRSEQERERLISELQEAISKIKTLSGMFPICSSCKKIRDDKGYWNQIEAYIRDHSEAEFSHSICPECMEKLYGNEDWYKKK